jgi:DNA-binding transcriptional regulator YiaG
MTEVVKMAAIKALVKPELLRWARNGAKVRLEDAAKAAHVTVERLQAWEHGGEDAPLNSARARVHISLTIVRVW